MHVVALLLAMPVDPKRRYYCRLIPAYLCTSAATESPAWLSDTRTIGRWHAKLTYADGCLLEKSKRSRRNICYRNVFKIL